MKIEILLTITGLFVSVCVNLCAISFFAGQMKAQQQTHKEQLEEIKKGFKETVDDIKNDFKDKLRDIKENITEKITENTRHFEEQIERLEKKQDKHNSTIERTFLLERQQGVLAEQMKVANHRIEDIETKIE